MSKRWTKVSRGVWEQVNATRRAARDRRKFLDTLKHGGRKVNDYVEMTHDGTDFTIKHTSNGDFWVDTGSCAKGFREYTNRSYKKEQRNLSNAQAAQGTTEEGVPWEIEVWQKV